jgi:hypothetical protein
MPKPQVRVLAKPQPVPKPRALPQPVLQARLELGALQPSELAARWRTIRENPLFRECVSAGVLVLTHPYSRGHLMEWMGRVAVTTIDKIAKQKGLDADTVSKEFLASDPEDDQRVRELCHKYGDALENAHRDILFILKGVHYREARKLQSSQADPSQLEVAAKYRREMHADASTDADIDQAIHTCLDFMRRYDVPPMEFYRTVYVEGRSPRDVSRQYDCPFPIAQAVVAACQSIQLQQLISDTDLQHMRPNIDLNQAVRDEPQVVAVVTTDDTGKVCMEWRAGYEVLCHIDKDRRAAYLAENPQKKDIVALLAEVDELNQLRSLLVHVLRALCEYQQAFLLSGDPLDRLPITDPQLAALVGGSISSRRVDATSIWRLFHGRDRLDAKTYLLDTTHGVLDVRIDLCPRDQHVVSTWAKQFPGRSARCLSEMMAARGISMPRRTVAYHLSKIRQGGQ